jgi:hypothetical protein
MANNIAVKDGGGNNQTVKTTDTSGVHVPHHNVDVIPPLGATADAAAGSDTADSSAIGLIKRALQHLTTVLGRLPAALTAGGGVKAGLVDAVPTGSNLIGDVALGARTTGGHSLHRLLSAASTNATSIKASAGKLYGIMASNIGVAPAYVKFYNKASSPTVGSDTPIMTIMVPANQGGIARELLIGVPFGTGLAMAVTGGAADADTTAVAANEVIVHTLYA